MTAVSTALARDRGGHDALKPDCEHEDAPPVAKGPDESLLPCLLYHRLTVTRVRGQVPVRRAGCACADPSPCRVPLHRIVGQATTRRGGGLQGCPRGGDEQRSLPRRARLPRRHTAVGLISGDLLTSRGGSSGEPPPAGCGTYPPARRRRATSRLSFCARPNRRSSARTPHSSLRPTSYGASSSAWRRAGSPRPGWPQPPSAARRSAEPRASPAGRRSRGSCRRRSTP